LRFKHFKGGFTHHLNVAEQPFGKGTFCEQAFYTREKGTDIFNVIHRPTQFNTGHLI